MGKVGAAVLAALVLIPLAITAGVSGGISALFGTSTTNMACTIGDNLSSAGAAGYGADQLANAAIIVAVGTQLNIPEQGQVVALAVALQESGLSNLDHGDRDSLGLFQQRPSQGWGSPAQIMNPAYAATQFYQHLLAVPGWQQMSINDAAQAVQRSGTPNAYAQHEHTAREVLAAVEGASCTTTASQMVGTGDCTAIQAPNAVTLAAINYACGQRGLPYVWGGNGAADGGFDCSGLTVAAYGAAGITLPRTADAQFRAGPRVPDGQPLLPGDLVFYGTTAHIHHVGLYIGGGLMIDAPDVGQSIKIEPYRYNGDDYAGATRPAGSIGA
ncbi:C40 family peptidase [Amycolatopsis taiwanensis]|uniref:C40 family peptidase n=1 Tax=Amycolatopsis taiwanensis TaxID=342230 RepID=UPI002554B700|nr:C40 family peptidase [Amycolatopsis taiwanensis]